MFGTVYFVGVPSYSVLKLRDFTMGKNQSKLEDCESEEAKTKIRIEKEGVEGALAMMREICENWSNVKIKIGVTESAGVGKSTFINTIRGYGIFSLFSFLFQLA